MGQKFKLSNGIEIEFDLGRQDLIMDAIVDKYLKPTYEKNNDWNMSLKSAISEVERFSAANKLSRGNMILAFLQIVEERLDKDIAEMAGTEKIEILFESIDDLVEFVRETITVEKDEIKARIRVAEEIEQLNLMEIAELLIHFAKKCVD